MADLWHYTYEGNPQGPISFAELKKRATSGLLKPTDLVWREGMSDWVRASASGAGLFADSSPQIVVERAAPVPLERVQDDGSLHGKHEPRLQADVSVRSSDRPRRRRYRPEGMGSGTKAAIVLFAILLLTGLIVAGVLLTVNTHRAATIQAGMPTVYTVTLDLGQIDSRMFTLKANTRYDITITSENHADLDFFIVWNEQDEVTQNINGANHRLSWVPRRSGPHRLELESHGNLRTRSTVSIREAGPGFPNNGPVGQFKNPALRGKAQHVDAVGNPHAIGPKGLTLNGALSNLDPPDLFPEEPPCRVYAVNMVAGKTYTIDLISNEFDAFLRLEDNNFVELAAHDDIDPGIDQNAKIIFPCNRTGVYRVVVRPLEVFDPMRNRISQGAYSLRIRDN